MSLPICAAQPVFAASQPIRNSYSAEVASFTEKVKLSANTATNRTSFFNIWNPPLCEKKNDYFSISFDELRILLKIPSIPSTLYNLLIMIVKM